MESLDINKDKKTKEIVSDVSTIKEELDISLDNLSSNNIVNDNDTQTTPSLNHFTYNNNNNNNTNTDPNKDNTFLNLLQFIFYKIWYIISTRFFDIVTDFNSLYSETIKKIQ